MSLGWFTFNPTPTDPDVHVVPVEDLRDHELTRQCWCSPSEDDEDADVVIHNALDGRDDGSGTRRLH